MAELLGIWPHDLLSKPIKPCKTVAIIRLFAMGSMRTQVVNFRAEQALVSALWDKARRDNVTLSAIIRDAVRERVGQQ